MVWPIIRAKSYVGKMGESMKAGGVGRALNGWLLQNPLSNNVGGVGSFRAHYKMHYKASFALWVAWYNFVRVNTAIRMTPCMAAGITGTIWTMRGSLAA